MSVNPQKSDDIRRLLSAISTLSGVDEVSGDYGRVLAPGNSSGHEMLGALLQEVNETVLRRTLAFHTGHEVPILLDVAERRILRVISAGSDVAAAQIDIVGRKLGAHHCAALFECLVTHVQRAQGLSVTSTLPDEPMSGGEGGVAYEALFKLHQQCSNTVEVQNPFASQLDSTVSLSTACLAFENGVSLSETGPEAEISVLKRLSNTIAHGHDKDPIRIWMTGFENANAVLCIRLEDLTVLAVIADCRLETCLRLWQPAI